MKAFSMFVAAGVLAASSLPAMAGFTTVGAPPSGEKTIQQILDAVYGGTFSPTGVNSFTNGTISAIRVNDNGGSGTNNVAFGPGAADDQIWTGGGLTANVEARYAGYSQKFGFLAGTSGGSYNNIFDVTGSGLAVSGGATVDMNSLAGGVWRWGRNGNDGSTFTSKDSDNVDRVDHFITYEITGYSSLKTWLIGVEDKLVNGGSDRDFNDLVVQVQAVPTPAAIGMGLTTLAAMGLAALRRRRAQA